jgi:hypothetical protein
LVSAALAPPIRVERVEALGEASPEPRAIAPEARMGLDEARNSRPSCARTKARGERLYSSSFVCNVRAFAREARPKEETIPMPLSVHQCSVAIFDVALNAFSAILDKAAAHAEAHKFDAAVYMTMRLRPDMMPFGRQVASFCDHAKNVSSRLAGVQAPVFEDKETTLDELKARIKKTLDYLATVDLAALEAGADREIVFRLGNKIKMSGADFLQHFAMPNFYFHLTTAYDILRYAGVEVGKRDFLGAIPGMTPL